MCAPLLPVFMIGTAIAGAGLGAYSAYQQGQAAEKIGQYNAQMQEQQAKVAEHQAQEAEVEGATQEVQQRMKVRQLIGASRAAMSASGAVVDTGSFADILDDTVKTGEMDILTIRSNAAKKAWGYRTQATMDRAQGQLDLYQGAAAKANARGAMWGSLINGASQTFGMVRNFNKEGWK